MVCRLRKSLYGLRQAPRCWFAKLSNALVQYGFQCSQSDHSLFIFRKGDVQLVMLVYVDNLVIAGSHREAIAKFKDYLHQCFHMKDLGKLKNFLGVEVAQSPTGNFLCQRKYALDIIAKEGLLGGKLVSTPIEENHRLVLADGELLSDPSQYRRLFGCLIYCVLHGLNYPTVFTS
uniref:Copia protein n=1 Tax=Cajanus cajan TaxID=3821 RepID=A0A151RXS3_CAJCA|nr:Copia protein [Cajanus cajan]